VLGRYEYLNVLKIEDYGRENPAAAAAAAFTKHQPHR
jgi:hypothetical protein